MIIPLFHSKVCFKGYIGWLCPPLYLVARDNSKPECKAYIVKFNYWLSDKISVDIPYSLFTDEETEIETD